MKADTAALGRIPISAYQYCEAVRTASSMGWYVFPPTDFSLSYDGTEVFIADEGEWRPLISEPLPENLESRWEAEFESKFGACPNMLSELSDPGVVQIFTGLFVSTPKNQWSHVRPLVNIHAKSSFWCYEGIVETDSFSPLPLFINIQMTRTNSEIYFPKEFPLFQISCVPSEIRDLNKAAHMATVFDDVVPMAGLSKTLRRQPGVSVPLGQYGTEVRKKRKQIHA
ncbi:hypothetical protein [Shimia sp. NS0008-38b]|uniref:hypothetical protein n=1 Tax=Shimia sp. NS0008-38b TaxID=3127653 RepID=UPI003342154E